MKQQRVIDTLLEPTTMVWLNNALRNVTMHGTRNLGASDVATAIFIATDRKAKVTVGESDDVYIETANKELVCVWAGNHWVPVRAETWVSA